MYFCTAATNQLGYFDSNKEMKKWQLTVKAHACEGKQKSNYRN